MKPATRNETYPLTRRDFVRLAVLAASGAALGLETGGQSIPAAARPIIGLSLIHI